MSVVKDKRKYEPLEKYLAQSKETDIKLTFSEIKDILDNNLPQSAYEYDYSWWGNDKTHVQAIAWMNAGYKTVDVKKTFLDGYIKFKKIAKV